MATQSNESSVGCLVWVILFFMMANCSDQNNKIKTLEDKVQGLEVKVNQSREPTF